MKTALLLLALQVESPVGEVTSVSADGKRARVSLGRAAGLKVQDALRIYSAPEIVTLPGTAKAAFAVEREVGAAVVVEVLDRESVAQVVSAAEPLTKGNRVTAGKPVKHGPLPPHIRERVALDPPEAAWAREVTLSLDVEDLDGDLAWVDCRVDRGLLLDPVSTLPRVRWLPPAEAGDVRLTVRAGDRKGLEDTRTFTLRAAGVPAAARPAAFALDAVFDAPFLRAADLASDSAGNLYVLDADLRRLVKWTPAGRRAWVSDRYGRDVDFARLVVVGNDALLVDRLGRRVVRYPMTPGLFAAGPARTYGEGRRRPGALRDPVDVAVLPGGDVWVLDAAEGTIKTYAEDGTYLTTVGNFGAPRGVRRGSGLAIHVLDARSREIITFEGGRVARRMRLEGDVPADFIDPSEVLFPDRWGARPLSDARSVRRDEFGRTYILAEEGRSLVRLTAQGETTTRQGGASLADAGTIRSLPDGGFTLQDGQTRWVFDSEGWLRESGEATESRPRTGRDAAGNTYELGEDGLRCGPGPVDTGGLRLRDFDLDPFGRVLLLEAGTGRVLRLRVTRWKD